MDDFSGLLKTVHRITFYFLSLCLMAWALLPQYRSLIGGILLGTTFSLLNTKYLAWKVEKLTQAVIEKSNRKINMGFMTRAALSLLAVVLAFKYPEQISFFTTLAGLFFTQLVTLLLGIVSNLKPRK